MRIGASAFYRCDKLRSVNLTGCSELIYIEGSEHAGIGYNYRGAFENCISLKTIDLSQCKKLRGILKGAFANCTSLESIGLSQCTELKQIGDSAFANYTSLENIDLSPCKKLEKIGERAFSGCSKLKSVNLSHYTEITEIGKEAFQNCVSLEAIDLSSSYYRFVEIVSSSFSGCSKAVVKLPAIIEVIGKDAFGGDNETYCKKVLVPNQTIRQLVISSGYPVTRIEMY